MQKAHPICFLYFTKPPKKKSFVDIGSESGYTNNRLCIKILRLCIYLFIFPVNIKLMKELIGFS